MAQLGDSNTPFEEATVRPASRSTTTGYQMGEETVSQHRFASRYRSPRDSGTPQVIDLELLQGLKDATHAVINRCDHGGESRIVLPPSGNRPETPLVDDRRLTRDRSRSAA